MRNHSRRDGSCNRNRRAGRRRFPKVLTQKKLPLRRHCRQEVSPWESDRQREHQRNVAAVFGESHDQRDEEPEQEEKTQSIEPSVEEPPAYQISSSLTAPVPAASPSENSTATMEEEEIEEEEADLASYVEELEEDAAFEELEEETQRTRKPIASPAHEIAASSEGMSDDGERRL